ncbi:hypothetical protein MHBO_001004 [Bonamia ostreae]|uniref:LAGLIDADG homing endonuclease n=1 Tax=Bonamia ostreae TaxID=126728 RepID=A0ABV2AHK3_9EUKA
MLRFLKTILDIKKGCEIKNFLEIILDKKEKDFVCSNNNNTIRIRCPNGNLFTSFGQSVKGFRVLQQFCTSGCQLSLFQKQNNSESYVIRNGHSLEIICEKRKIKQNLNCIMGTLYTKIWTILDSKNKIADFCKNLCPLNKENGFNVDLIESGLNATVYCLNKKFVKIGNKFFDSVEIGCHNSKYIFNSMKFAEIKCQNLNSSKFNDLGKKFGYYYTLNDKDNTNEIHFKCNDKIKYLDNDWKNKINKTCSGF